MDAKVVTAPTELLPCPFCGGRAERRDDPGVCGVPFGLVADHQPSCFLGLIKSEDAMVVAWNTRHCPDPVSAAEGDLLGRCVDLLAIIGDALSGVICPGSNDCISYLGDDARTSLELALPDVRSILSQVREVRG